MARISTTTRNGLLLIAVAVVVAVSLILAITLSNRPEEPSRPRRFGKAFLDQSYFIRFSANFQRNQEFQGTIEDFKGDSNHEHP